MNVELRYDLSIVPLFTRDDAHPPLMPAELDHLIHLQAARQLMRDEEHRDLAFELVDGGKMEEKWGQAWLIA